MERESCAGTTFSGYIPPQIGAGEQKQPFAIEEGKQPGANTPLFGPARKQDTGADQTRPHFKPLGRLRKPDATDTGKHDIIEADFKSASFEEETEPAMKKGPAAEPKQQAGNIYHSAQLGIMLVKLSEKEHKAL